MLYVQTCMCMNIYDTTNTCHKSPCIYDVEIDKPLKIKLKIFCLGFMKMGHSLFLNNYLYTKAVSM